MQKGKQNYYSFICEKKLESIEKEIHDINSSLTRLEPSPAINEEDGLLVPEFLDLPYAEKVFLINEVQIGRFNIPTAIKYFEDCIKIQKTGNQLLLKSTQYLKVLTSIQTLSSLYTTKVKKLKERKSLLEIFQKSTRIVRDLLDSDFDKKYFDITKEELINIIKSSVFKKEEWNDILFIIVKNFQERYVSIYEEKRKKVEKRIAAKKAELDKVAKESSKVRELEDDIEKEVNRELDVFFSMDDIKEKLDNYEGINRDELREEIFVTIVLENKNVTKDEVFKVAYRLLDEYILDENAIEYKFLIYNNPKIKTFIENYINYPMDDICRLFAINNVEIDEEIIIEKLKQILINEFNYKANSINKSFIFASYILNGSLDNVKGYNSGNNDDEINEETLAGVANAIELKTGLDKESIEHIIGEIMLLPDKLSEHIDLLFKKYDELESEEEQDIYLALINDIPLLEETFKKAVSEKEYYSLLLIYDDEIEGLLSLIRGINNIDLDFLEEQELEKEDLGYDFKRILFFDDINEELKAIKDVKNLRKIHKLLTQLDQSGENVSFDNHGYRSEKLSDDERVLKDYKIRTNTGETKERLFFRIVGSGDKAKIIVFMAEAKKTNSSNQTINLGNAANKLNKPENKERLDYLIEAASNEEGFDEEFKKQEEIRKQILTIINKKNQSIGGV